MPRPRWSRTAIIYGALYFLIVATACISPACTWDLSVAPEPRVRPKNVPASAVYRHSDEWGYYFDCDTKQKEFNNCTVYYPNGTVKVQGRFCLETSNRAATRSELIYEYFDGKAIELKGAGWLVPLKVRPKSVRTSAVYKYGMENVDYFDCDTDRKEFNYCTLYHDDGTVAVQGPFRLETYNRAATRSELKYLYFQGPAILLEDNKSLVPFNTALAR